MEKEKNIDLASRDEEDEPESEIDTEAEESESELASPRASAPETPVKDSATPKPATPATPKEPQITITPDTPPVVPTAPPLPSVVFSPDSSKVEPSDGTREQLERAARAAKEQRQAQENVRSIRVNLHKELHQKVQKNETTKKVPEKPHISHKTASRDLLATALQDKLVALTVQQSLKGVEMLLSGKGENTGNAKPSLPEPRLPRSAAKRLPTKANLEPPTVPAISTPAPSDTKSPPETPTSPNSGESISPRGRRQLTRENVPIRRGVTLATVGSSSAAAEALAQVNASNPELDTKSTLPVPSKLMPNIVSKAADVSTGA